MKEEMIKTFKEKFRGFSLEGDLYKFELTRLTKEILVYELNRLSEKYDVEYQMFIDADIVKVELENLPEDAAISYIIELK